MEPLRSGLPRDSVIGQVLLELTVPAITAWTFINAPEGSTWWIEAGDTNYSGCRIKERFVVNEHMVRLTFTYQSKSVRG